MARGGGLPGHLASCLFLFLSRTPGASLEAGAPPAAASSGSSGIPARAGREGAVARVARTLSRPPCLAAPLRPDSQWC